jgi:hypothetical protein
MITDPDYITRLREQHGCFDVLNLLNLSAIGPGWYLLTDIAERFATHRSNINTSMLRLRKQGLIDYVSYGAGGTFLWFIKDSADAKPDPERYPHWRLRDLEADRHHRYLRVNVGQVNEFAKQLQVHPGTARNFLSGRYKRLLDRYEVASSPFDP